RVWRLRPGRLRVQRPGARPRRLRGPRLRAGLLRPARGGRACSARRCPTATAARPRGAASWGLARQLTITGADTTAEGAGRSPRALTLFAVRPDPRAGAGPWRIPGGRLA